MASLALVQPEPEVAETAAVTPMMRQYLHIKREYPDAILFYHLGDFYEMFYEDAITASKILDLTLTTRNKNSPDPVPMCGVPIHAAKGYIATLVQHGHRVAICEQTEDPALTKGLVKREVVRVVTAGTQMDDAETSRLSNQFLIAVYANDHERAIALADVTTGLLEYQVCSSWDDVRLAIEKHHASEVIVSEDRRNSFASDIGELGVQPAIHTVHQLAHETGYANDLIASCFDVQSADVLGLNGCARAAVGMLIAYLKTLKILTPGLLSLPRERQHDLYVHLDERALSHLDILTDQQGARKGSLLWHLDDCETPMGSRMLAQWLRYPLRSQSDLRLRHEVVSALYQDESCCERLRALLNQCPDLERLTNRFLGESANARDAQALALALQRVPHILTATSNLKCARIDALRACCADFSDLVQQVLTTVVSEPPLTVREGGLIAAGVSVELDELRHLESNAKQVIAELEARERVRTQIHTLKVRYNSVFGYYIEITHANKDKVPQDYIRKQTLSNAERYITDELKQLEAKVLSSGERARQIEYQIFSDLRLHIRARVHDLRQTAQTLAEIDVLSAFAHTARLRRYVCPQLVSEPVLRLERARHPVIERLLTHTEFMPNDIVLDQHTQQHMLMTGPNMAGKSTILRTVGQIAVMAHIGSFVPCTSAILGVCDQIFTRVGAHDHLQRGQSTFMVEMVETSHILRQATAHSLILLDEIGRGTSTFDGLSLAWAIAEDIHDRIGARSLFATHYHELCDLAGSKSRLFNMHMDVVEHKGRVVFLHQLKPGPASRSYGIAVAQMAGLPRAVVVRAKHVMAFLDERERGFQSDVAGSGRQVSLFELESQPATHVPDPKIEAVMERLNQIDTNHLTPLAALQVLDDLKRMLT